MQLPRTATRTYSQSLSVAVLLWLAIVAPAASFATSFIDLSPPCCHGHHVDGIAGLFAKNSCCCRRAAAHSSTPAIHSRSQCGSGCGHALNGLASPAILIHAGFASWFVLPPFQEILAPRFWGASPAQILAIHRYQRPPPSFS